MANYRRKTARFEWGTDRKLFRYRAGDDLTTLGAVFARTGEGRYVDANGVLQTAATGVARDNHWIGGARHLLIEAAGTNLCIRSQDFAHADWGKGTGITVPVTNATAPDGSLTACRIDNSGAVTSSPISRPCTFTGDGEKCAAIYLKAGTAAVSALAIHDTTAAVTRHRITITWTAGVPSLSTATGSGSVFTVEALGNGWYRILFSANGIVAANGNGIYLYPSGTAAVAGTVFAWGAQVENDVVPSSYVATTSATATRNADSLYFPFAAVPQGLSLYQRSTNAGLYSASTTSRYGAHVGAENPLTDPRLALYVSSSGAVGCVYDDGTTQVTSQVGSAQALGVVVEHLGTLSASWEVQGARTDNGGAVSTGTLSSPSGAALAFAATRIYFSTASAVSAPRAYREVVAASGVHTLERMRALAGAGATMFATFLSIGYPLDEAVSYSRPAEGSRMLLHPSGEVDGWDAGTAHFLDAVLRWVPREDTATPLATGWDGTAGVRAFLEHCRRGNAVWFTPDVTDLAAGWTVHLEAPFDEPPELEADMTRAVRVRLRATTAIDGY